MAREIERKYLVTSSDFEAQTIRREHVVQGYLCADAGRTVRVRICGAEAFLTVKSAPDAHGLGRDEFEYPVPVADAQAMLMLCVAGIIDKVRHWVASGGHVWEVDVFHGANEGLTVAELELASENEPFDLPAWAGREVTGDPRYYNAMLIKHPFEAWT